MAIGDTEAARRSLKEFATFIETEQLDDRDTILKIDSRLPSAQKRPEVVDEFDAIAQRHMAIGDTEAARRSLKEFATFIETEQLDDRDTILKIDSRLPSAQKRPEVVDEFDAIAQRTMQLSALTAGESVPKRSSAR